LADKIPKNIEARLRRAATPEGADTYAAYLLKIGNPHDTADSMRQAAATDGARVSPDHGTAGEALREGGLADDGYAAYLRRAAKEQRAAREAQIEAARTQGARAAMAGYASYLDEKRAEQESRLLEAARALMSVPLDAPNERDRLIDAATESPEAAAALREAHTSLHEKSEEGREGHVNDVLSYIMRNNLPYDRAYTYCRLLGYSDGYAERLARYATEERLDLMEELEDLFGS
jgi:hypothetical protein